MGHEDVREMLPRRGGVSTIGSHQESLVEDAAGARLGTAVERSGRRVARSDETKLAYEALLKAGKVAEAQALYRKGKVAHRKLQGEGDSVQELVDQGAARGVDGARIRPGSKAPNVVEGPLHNRAGPEGSAGVWDSVTGRVRVSIDQGSKNDKELNYRVGVNNSLKLLALAIREVALGGDPIDVFDAFNIKMKDLDGHELFPIDRSAVVRPAAVTPSAEPPPWSPESAFETALGTPPAWEPEVPAIVTDPDDAEEIADLFRAMDPDVFERAINSLDPMTLNRLGLVGNDEAATPVLGVVPEPDAGEEGE